jgi:hypothetical protein
MSWSARFGDLDQHRARPQRRPGGSARPWTRHRFRKPRARFRVFLHHEIQWCWNGPIDMPVNHQWSWGPAMGGAEYISRRCVSVYLAQRFRRVTSGIGPSRHFVAAQQFDRFRSEPDIKWRPGPIGSVANDPEPKRLELLSQTLTKAHLNRSRRCPMGLISGP